MSAAPREKSRCRERDPLSTLWRWLDDGEGHVLVTDVMMPDGDALDILPVLRRKRPKLPVIVMSAQNTVMTAIRANEAGAYEYLPKPFVRFRGTAQVHQGREGLPDAQRP